MSQSVSLFTRTALARTPNRLHVYFLPLAAVAGLPFAAFALRMRSLISLQRHTHSQPRAKKELGIFIWGWALRPLSLCGAFSSPSVGTFDHDDGPTNGNVAFPQPSV